MLIFNKISIHHSTYYMIYTRFFLIDFIVYYPALFVAYFSIHCGNFCLLTFITMMSIYLTYVYVYVYFVAIKRLIVSHFGLEYYSVYVYINIQSIFSTIYLYSYMSTNEPYLHLWFKIDQFIGSVINHCVLLVYICVYVEKYCT